EDTRPANPRIPPILKMNRAYKNHGSTHEKTYNWSKLLVGNLIVWLSSAVSFAPLHAVAQTNWKLRPTETGNWSNGDNWDNGLPANDRDAGVDNGGTVEVNTKAAVRNLTIGLQDVNSTVVNDNGGTVEVNTKAAGRN